MRSVGRSASTALRVYHALQKRIIVTATHLTRELDLTWPAVQGALTRLEALGVAKEITGRARGRIYAYDQQLALLNRGVASAESPAG